MTTIVRWNPFREMAAMQSALDRMFEDSWRSTWPTWNSTAATTLPFDVYETDQAYTAVVSVPGINPEQINVRLEEGALTVSGEMPQFELPQNARYLLQERPFGQFSRSFRLPQAIDSEHVEAAYENGVLTLTLPKAPEAQPKFIPIKANGKALNSKN
jgi:HSP20 family protein